MTSTIHKIRDMTTPSPSASTNSTKAPERCPQCRSKDLVRKGVRKKKLETVQLWRCNSCHRVFTPQHIRGKTYPLRTILEGVSLFNQGFERAEVCRRVKQSHGAALATSTLSCWLAEHRELCSYSRLRTAGRRLFTANQIIRKIKLYHRQVYEFSIHRAKLELLAGPESSNKRFLPLAAYLENMLRNCPHGLFQENSRASQAVRKFDLSEVMVSEKQNFATRMAQLVLPTVRDNYRRHEVLQRFILLNDSVTVATEIPIYLFPEDVEYMRRALGFGIPLEIGEALTGHIDFLQIRNGAVHILDYKPDARSNRPIEQLTLYALALSRLTGLRLYDFKCAWFNQEGYFEFFPLHVVHKRALRQPAGP